MLVERTETYLSREEKAEMAIVRREAKAERVANVADVEELDLITMVKDGYITRDSLQDLSQEQRRLLVKNDCMKYITDYPSQPEPEFSNVVDGLSL